MRRRHAFTILEATIAVALFGAIGYVLVDVMTTENKNAAALMDDLAVNGEARAVLQQIARDVRSASEVLLDPTQINPPPNTIGIDERLSRITLRYAAPVVQDGSLRRFQVEYRLVGKTQSPPASLPAERARKYNFLGQGEKWVYPLLRETALLEPGAPPRVKATTVVGHVRELSFYRTQPAVGLEIAALPTVYLKLTMSAFKPGPGGAIAEAYREEFSTALTARALVPSLVGRAP